jgi:hypothetical protein
MVWCPEQLLQCVLAHIHYMPDHWRDNANKSETRDEVAQLFQYKAVGEKGQTVNRRLIGFTLDGKERLNFIWLYGIRSEIKFFL